MANTQIPLRILYRTVNLIQFYLKINLNQHLNQFMMEMTMKMIILYMFLIIKSMVKMIFLFNDYHMFISMMILNHALLSPVKNIMKKTNKMVGIIYSQVVNQLHFQKSPKRENNNNSKKKKNSKLILSIRYKKSNKTETI